jgi:hypothetical protein
MIPLYLALFSLLLGLFSPVWFGRLLPPVRRLRQGAQWIDPQAIKPPAGASITVQSLREHEKCGDQIVVAHHLADWSRDLQKKIFQSLVFNAAASLVLVVVYVVYQDRALQAPTATIRDLAETVAHVWPLSLVFAFTILEVIIFVKLVHDQAAKYAKVIDAAKPPKKRLRERAADLWRRLRG